MTSTVFFVSSNWEYFLPVSVCFAIFVKIGRCECFSNVVIPQAITFPTNPTPAEHLLAKTGDKNIPPQSRE